MTMRIIIAGGGTGGHLFPGIALAEEFMTRHAENDVLFVGTKRGIEKDLIPSTPYPIEFIEVSGLKGKSFTETLKNILKLPRSLFQALRIIRKYKPGIVIAVGGYASGPTALAAWLKRVPVVVQEQNALPGFTTRIVARFAKKAFIAFDEAANKLPAGKVMKTGNPIRQSLLENYLRPMPERTEAVPGILVLGGSQGALTINRNMAEAFRIINKNIPEARVFHQAGHSKVEEVKELYEKANLLGKVRVVPFIEDMSKAYSRADVVVCRAGATTVAELTICRRASILIPYPHAADNHQLINARALADRGAAVLLEESELNPEKLAKEVLNLLGDTKRRMDMSAAAGRLGWPEAAREIADVCVDVWVQSGGLARERRALAEGKRS